MPLFKSLLLIVPFVICYFLGGQGPKFMRRWIGPSVLAAVIVLFQMNLVALLALLYLAAANGFSYGIKYTHDRAGLKILFRGLCGASYGLVGLIVGILAGHPWLGALQLLLATSGSILFGVLNPFKFIHDDKSTMLEDACIASSYVILLPFMI